MNKEIYEYRVTYLPPNTNYCSRDFETLKDAVLFFGNMDHPRELIEFIPEGNRFKTVILISVD